MAFDIINGCSHLTRKWDMAPVGSHLDFILALFRMQTQHKQDWHESDQVT